MARDFSPKTRIDLPIQTMTVDQSRTLLDAVYLVHILLYRNKLIKIPEGMNLEEVDLMSCMRALTAGHDETSRDYFAENPPAKW